MMVVVYKITNLSNEKIYVGQTRQRIEKRFLQHSKSNSPLGKAMRECGLENFTIEIIERCETQEELNEREKFWIKVLNSKFPKGYNLSNGGAGFVRQKNYSDDSAVKIFSGKLKMLRESKGITQAEFAKIIGVAQQTVGSWEKGNSAPNYEILKKIADYFNVSADYLLGRENANKNISLSDEQKHLLKDFDSLNADGRNTLWTVLNSLCVTHSAQRMTAAI